MTNADTAAFLRLSDGTLLERQPDGAYRPTKSRTDVARLKALTEAEIEATSSSDEDHPGLGASFWKSADHKQEQPVRAAMFDPHNRRLPLTGHQRRIIATVQRRRRNARRNVV